MTIDWTPLADLIETHDRWLVTIHVRPDGDALGSEVGMAGLLRHKGKDVRVVNASPTPPRYEFLDPEHTLFEQFGNSVGEADLADREVAQHTRLQPRVRARTRRRCGPSFGRALQLGDHLKRRDQLPQWIGMLWVPGDVGLQVHGLAGLEPVGQLIDQGRQGRVGQAVHGEIAHCLGHGCAPDPRRPARS
jgi:hypothetical protein